MMSGQPRNDELECRGFLLDFFSSELSAHSRLIVGFSVILLTLIEIILRLDKSIYGVRFIAYSGVFLVSFGLWYLFMRHLVYGVLAHSTISAVPPDENGDLLVRVTRAVARDALEKRMLAIFPAAWFFSYEERRIKTILLGVAICLLFALVTTFLLVWLVDHELIASIICSLRTKSQGLD